MRELLRTNDLVVISLVESLLKECEIHFIVLDGNMSTLEGSIGAIRRRVMVDGERYDEARQIMRDAGLGHEMDD